MPTGGLRLFAVRGIDVRVDASWLIIAALITWSFWGRFEYLEPERSGMVAVVMALVAAVLFFVSLLVHELAHALEAQRRGVEVSSITLFLFGGVTQTSFDVKRPRDEFTLTAVGPLSSFMLAGAFGLAATGADALGWGTGAEVAGLVAWINVLLGGFNLIPGAPLDGGRILRSLVWWRTGDRRRAIRVAGQSGRVVGAALIGLGVLQLLFVQGAFVGGVWLIFIGWFLSRAAMAEVAQSQLEELLDDRTAGDVAARREAVAADTTLDELVDRWLTGDEPDVVPVTDQGRLVGVIGVDAVGGIGADERDRTQVGSVMAPLDSVTTVAKTAPATDALDAVKRQQLVLVIDDEEPIGVVTTEQLVALAQRRASFETASTRR